MALYFAELTKNVLLQTVFLVILPTGLGNKVCVRIKLEFLSEDQQI